MKKNLLRTCIGLAVGGTLLISSSIMGMADGPNGYDTLKAAFKNSNKIENATFNMSGSINDNNKEIVKVSSTFKADEQDHLFSGVISIKNDKIDKNFTLFGSKAQMVFKDDSSSVYTKFAGNKELKGKKFSIKSHDFKEQENPQMEAIGEKIMDTLVGDLKKQVTQKDLGNGEKQININLDKNEIPSLVNLMLAAKGDSTCDTKDKMHEILGINPDDCKLPELTSNIQAEEMDIQIVVDENNIIKEMDAKFDITGNDAQNQVHNQELKFSIDVSGINSTTVDTVDLNGKEVKEISSEEFGYDK